MIINKVYSPISVLNTKVHNKRLIGLELLNIFN